MSYKIDIPKPIMIDKIDIDRLKKMFYNNDIHYDSITTSDRDWETKSSANYR